VARGCGAGPLLTRSQVWTALVVFSCESLYNMKQRRDSHAAQASRSRPAAPFLRYAPARVSDSAAALCSLRSRLAVWNHHPALVFLIFSLWIVQCGLWLVDIHWVAWRSANVPRECWPSLAHLRSNTARSSGPRLHADAL